MAAVLAALITFLDSGTARSNPATSSFAGGRASFSVAFQEEIGRYSVLAAFVLPEEEIQFHILEDNQNRSFRFDGTAGDLLETTPRAWRWRAPLTSGLYPVRITAEGERESILLNIFVLIPLARVSDGSLNGYRIGNYPDKPLRGLEIYRPPTGFVEVTLDNLETVVSPHFTLGQFVCKQESGYPKYLVLRTLLLRKLEFILQRLNSAEIRCDGLAIMSGYRTPWYNKFIGNVRYSRHVWGGAADVFVDENPRDGRMDDLNGDGRIDARDAAIIYKIADDQFGTADWTSFVGGMGQYRSTRNHGPFVHVDVRGFRARWGD